MKVKVKKCRDGTYKIYGPGNKMVAGPFDTRREAVKYSKYYKDNKLKKPMYELKKVAKKVFS